MADKTVRITHFSDGFAVDWPSGTSGTGLSLAEVILRLESFANDLRVEWSPRAQAARVKELKASNVR